MMVNNSFLNPYSKLSLDPLQYLTVKLLDCGEEGHRSESEIASLRAAFTQEVAVWHKLDHPNVTKVRFTFLSYDFHHREIPDLDFSWTPLLYC